MAGLRQQRLRLCRIERIAARRAVFAEIAGRHHRAAFRSDILADVAHQVVDVDGMRDRPPHADVVERRDRAVDVQGAKLAGAEDIDDHVAAPARRLDPALLALAVHEVELAGREREFACAVGRDQAIHDRVDLRPAAKVAVMRDQLHVLLRHVFSERERAGADRAGAELVAELFGGLFADDVAAVIVRNPAEEVRIGILQHDADRVVVDRGDAVDAGEVAGKARAPRVSRSCQRIDNVVGRQLAVIAVKLDALAQMERPGLAIFGGVPALRQIRLDVLRLGAAGRKADEAVEYPADDALVGRRGGAVRIERGDVGAAGADLQHALLRRGGALAERQRCENQCGR